jgi:hypothetical protein
MFYLINRYTGQQIQPNVSREYGLRVLAEKQAEQESLPLGMRVDVVKISRSSRLRLENQIREEALHANEDHKGKEGLPSLNSGV